MLRQHGAAILATLVVLVLGWFGYDRWFGGGQGAELILLDVGGEVLVSRPGEAPVAAKSLPPSTPSWPNAHRSSPAGSRSRFSKNLVLRSTFTHTITDRTVGIEKRLYVHVTCHKCR